MHTPNATVGRKVSSKYQTEQREPHSAMSKQRTFLLEQRETADKVGNGNVV